MSHEEKPIVAAGERANMNVMEDDCSNACSRFQQATFGHQRGRIWLGVFDAVVVAYGLIGMAGCALSGRSRT